MTVYAIVSQVHAYIIGALAKEMPRLFGRDAKKKELIANLPKIYEQLQWSLKIAPGDFPDIKFMQVCFINYLIILLSTV